VGYRLQATVAKSGMAMLISKIKTASSRLLKISLFCGILLFTTPQSGCMGLADRFDYLSAEDKAKVLDIIEQLETTYSAYDAAATEPLLAQLALFLSAEDNQDLLAGMLNESLDHNQYDMAEIAIKLGANPNHILPNENISVLTSLAQGGSAQAVEFLLKAGADACQETLLRGVRYNALCAGFFNEKNFLAISELLIPRVNINCPVLGGGTPLHLAACMPRRTTLTALLLEQRAEPNAKEENFQGPLDIIFQDPDRLGRKHLYKTALLLHTYGADITFETLPHFEHYFTPKQLEHIAQERARRESDLVCIRKFCTPEQLKAQPFKELYKSALTQVVARFLTALPTALAPIISDYATYDPAIDFELCDEPEKEPEYKRAGKMQIIPRKKKKKKLWRPRKQCVLQ
jgi:hypothetical protein